MVLASGGNKDSIENRRVHRSEEAPGVLGVNIAFCYILSIENSNSFSLFADVGL